jgi:hypothetical protein
MNKKDPREPLYKYVKDHYWSVRNSSASTLSTTCRQLALGEGGLCWLIKAANFNCHISSQINFIFILLVIFFILDALQYLVISINYHDLAKKYDEKILKSQIKKIEKLSEPKNVNRISNIFFILKLFTLVLASLILMCAILLT